MKDLCELIELTECELDEVAGGNPFEAYVYLFAEGRSRITSTVSTAFSNAPLVDQTNTSDQSVSISGP
jgi:hypothetical protein